MRLLYVYVLTCQISYNNSPVKDDFMNINTDAIPQDAIRKPGWNLQTRTEMSLKL